MIAMLHGTAAQVGVSEAVVMVGGIGYSVFATPATLASTRVGQEVTWHTELVVREDSLTLFAFESASEKQMFATLQSVSGVGPKVALAVLAVHAPGRISEIVQSGDAKALQQVPGIGAKLAARMMLELGGKVQLVESTDARSQVVDALVSLGWPQTQAYNATHQIAPKPIASSEVSNVLKGALQSLGSSRG